MRVLRLRSYIPTRPGALVHRLLYDASFALVAGLTALLLPRADVYLYVGAQPAVAAATALVARIKRRPWVAKVADLAVNAGAAVGMIRSPTLARLLRSFEYATYKRADAVLVLTEGFAEELTSHGLSEHRLHIVRDSEDLASLIPTTGRQEARQRHGLDPDRPLITHIGSIGRKQGLQVAVQAADGDLTGACWLLVGDGPERETIERAAPARRMRFLPFLPRQQLADVLAASDLALLTQRRQVIEAVIPSKLVTYMAAGLAVVASVHTDSEAARLIRKAGCGLVVEPETPDALRDAVADRCWLTPARRQQLGDCRPLLRTRANSTAQPSLPARPPSSTRSPSGPAGNGVGREHHSSPTGRPSSGLCPPAGPGHRWRVVHRLAPGGRAGRGRRASTRRGRPQQRQARQHPPPR